LVCSDAPISVSLLKESRIKPLMVNFSCAEEEQNIVNKKAAVVSNFFNTEFLNKG